MLHELAEGAEQPERILRVGHDGAIGRLLAVHVLQLRNGYVPRGVGLVALDGQRVDGRGARQRQRVDVDHLLEGHAVALRYVLATEQELKHGLGVGQFEGPLHCLRGEKERRLADDHMACATRPQAAEQLLRRRSPLHEDRLLFAIDDPNVHIAVPEALLMHVLLCAGLDEVARIIEGVQVLIVIRLRRILVGHGRRLERPDAQHTCKRD
mmetsp:Transcript_125276/g.350793  ORF Transcript_125276/g.350793 Transcript_125276/m.350793 type:complete len:210 (-) Transcript_125276:3-632(-)